VSQIATLGIDHVGLTVTSLDSTKAFFLECLGWSLRGERPEYPAAFVTDGNCVVTLWQVKSQGDPVPFDRRNNIGLHHLALKVANLAELKSLFAKVSAWPGVTVQFGPELSGKGPRMHCMVFEPGGIRIEFVCDP
jgi:catechol 2,3-dioxygenase-like lactoylglutathione lyase family enzyme